MKDTQFCFERREKKYMLTEEQAARILSRLAPRVRADDYARGTVSSVYYDTPDFALIRASIEKPIYKEKLRLRGYSSSADEAFLEIKKKYDGVVYKRRVKLPTAAGERYLAGQIPPPCDGQIMREIEWFCRSYPLEPKVVISCERQALCAADDANLRITFDRSIRCRDYDLSLRCGDGGELMLPSDAVLMEIKIPGAAPTWLSRILSEEGAFSSGFSKYGCCYGKLMKGRIYNCA